MIKNLLIKLMETNSNSEIDLVSELKLILEPLVGLIFSKQFKLLNNSLESSQNYMMNFNVYNCELEESTLNHQLNAVNDSSSDDFPIGHINLCEAQVEISELDINQKLFKHNEKYSSILSSQTQHLTNAIPDTVQEKTQFLEEILGNLIDKEINTYSKNCQEYDSLVSYLTILNQPKEDLINQLNLLKVKDFLNLNLLLDKKI
ncbi:hypothetical protein CONCODRAFT_84798 [Conidiobolus coronatus NRRL 28638]|uniref:Uncharacterized protein n=1 Tax=Conidiobolus coronatus (strain ATCC 28846 / CBS 209.66 / NRRL 28638) TaxID=796925 RepID=A0A137P8J5_CONC2|nr:hypothetical protein CONCODRAFT_84798 [Conidiobolus coronatus NRRL 28638]|eukprot:KXN71251.1 hypothetical protein CONCODRAFT_84798 [Conidiobolus coronatus NRRL 28638]